MIRYPYHRYLAYQAVAGDDPQEICSHMADLEFIAPRPEDVEELCRDVLRSRVAGENLVQRYDIGLFDRHGSSQEAMFWLVETEPARSCVQRLLATRVDVRAIAAVVSFKFDERVTVEAVEMFRDGFWDTARLSPVDFAEYYHLGGLRKPDPPPERVPLNQRPLYGSWSEGVVPGDEDLGVEDMIRNIAVDSYFRFKELSSRPDVDSQKQALSFASMVLKTAPSAMRRASSSGRGEVIPALKPMIEYPDYNVPSLEDLNRDDEDDAS